MSRADDFEVIDVVEEDADTTPLRAYPFQRGAPVVLPPPPPLPRYLEDSVSAMRGELKAVLSDVRALRSDMGQFSRELGALRRACGFEPPLPTDPAKPRAHWQVRQFVTAAAGAAGLAMWELLSAQVHAWFQ